MAHQHLQPEGLFPSERLGFTQVVTSAPGRTVYVSGQVGCDEAGRPVSEDLAGQAAQALVNVGRALDAAGASREDVAMIRVYIVDYAPELAPIVSDAIGAFFAGAKPPASTWLGVPALFHPAFRIEIEVVAVVS
jgi:enamine deaminase RidA (YjgF/YER057c/UK114 family)